VEPLFLKFKSQVTISFDRFSNLAFFLTSFGPFGIQAYLHFRFGLVRP